MRVRLEWNEEAIEQKLAIATSAALNITMKRCVERARSGHDKTPPSEEYTPYANRTQALTESIQIMRRSYPLWRGQAGRFAAFGGEGTMSGEWGSDLNYALYLEIGTSVSGPTAEMREEAAAGNSELPLWGAEPPIGPYMAPRPFLRPAAEIEYPLLAPRIRTIFEGL